MDWTTDRLRAPDRAVSCQEGERPAGAAGNQPERVSGRLRVRPASGGAGVAGAPP
ncbi:hypothetical protein AB0G97_02085 [Streptomyces sp. NPDC020755]|uniref:hypothetical protein n=1 Tax=Streptomyces sp. NPDC020755 TaxID=3154790 RepID=UPI0033DB9667